VILCLAISVEHSLVTDGQTDGQTTANTRGSWYCAGKNWSENEWYWCDWVVCHSAVRANYADLW